MHPVLFEIPGIGWPIHGYGFMLFLAFVFCTWLAAWQARKEGIEPKHVQDLAIWLFVTGIAGARITWMIQYGKFNYSGGNVSEYLLEVLLNFVRVWEGGLVFYGSAIGGAIGFVLAYWFILRKHGISSWKMADIVAPCIALGLCIGRLGCLLNGCCYGGVACPTCPGITFPLDSPPHFEMVARGWQTGLGFTLTDDPAAFIVGAVEPNSVAFKAGVRPGDQITGVTIGDRRFSMKIRKDYDDAGLGNYFNGKTWPRGINRVQFSIQRDGRPMDDVGPFEAHTIRLHPTQVYESISMALLFLVLMAYAPFKTRDGSVLVLLMFCYAVHRFFNEMLRDDTNPVALGMTLSQNISLLMLAGALLLWIIVRLRQPGGMSKPGGELPPAGSTAIRAGA